MPASELIERVSTLIAEVHGAVPTDVRDDLDRLDARLREPLRVAVVGRVNAGKSTLVNALLGIRAAPTDVSECTRLVTWFRYGHPQRLTARLKDGGELELQLTVEGGLPTSLPVPVTEIESLEAFLANEALRSMTLIDTPGVGSVHATLSASTTQLLTARSTMDAAAAADAVVFLLTQPVMMDELETLRRRGTADDEHDEASAPAVGVLGRADQLGDGSSPPWQLALELAAHYAGLFRDEVATVVPVMGLIAETAEAATLTEGDARELRRLSEMDSKQLGRLLWSVDRFVSEPAPVSPEVRERLLEKLDLYGVDLAVRFVDKGDPVGATAIRRHLAEVSGIAEVKRLLSAYFREQDHVLKVRSALDALRRLGYSQGGGTSDGLAVLRSKVDALRGDPVMHPIAELEVLHEAATGKLVLPAGLTDELRRVLAPGGPATRLGLDHADSERVREVARDGMIRWRTFMNTEASPVQARACRVVMRTYQLIWEAGA